MINWSTGQPSRPRETRWGILLVALTLSATGLLSFNFLKRYFALLPSLTILPAFILQMLNTSRESNRSLHPSSMMLAALAMPVFIPALGSVGSSVQPNRNRQLDQAVRDIQTNSAPNQRISESLAELKARPPKPIIGTLLAGIPFLFLANPAQCARMGAVYRWICENYQLIPPLDENLWPVYNLNQ